MALDIIIGKTDGSTSRLEFPEGLHQSLFPRTVKIKKNNILFHIRDYYLTDCSFRGEDIARLVTALEAASARLPAEHVQPLNGMLAALAGVDVAYVAFAGD